jgi:hypothetical protein
MSDIPSAYRPCRTCGINFPRTAAHYHRDANNLDGYKLQCRTCANEEARRRYEANAEEVCQRLRVRRVERSAMFAALERHEVA